jgi:hypothetical protein
MLIRADTPKFEYYGSRQGQAAESHSGRKAPRFFYLRAITATNKSLLCNGELVIGEGGESNEARFSTCLVAVFKRKPKEVGPTPDTEQMSSTW